MMVLTGPCVCAGMRIQEDLCRPSHPGPSEVKNDGGDDGGGKDEDED